MDISKLIFQEGIAQFSLGHWQYRDVNVRGYFIAFGYRFLVVHDPRKPSWFTVIEEKTGRRLCQDFRYRSIGAAVDRAIDVITENKDRLEFHVTVTTGLAQRSFKFQPVSPTIVPMLWK